MRNFVLPLFVFASGPAALLAETCPPGPDIEPALATLIAEGQAADRYMPARDALRDMWALWKTPPDTWSGELLDVGKERLDVADYEGALKAFDALVAYCPTWAEGWNQRAYVFFNQERYGEALVDLDRAIALSPNHIPALSGKGATLLRMGRVDEGEVWLKKAVDLHPWLPERGLIRELYGAPR
ncbi:tetratricopeptide repeat protein [uncultured Maritimibacter sp.]|jgi:tetratricopeptide (TPR) repeat protein|uniref:tetratricopeptide repeat protein n=1 Tax=uncultured Maritimibacter sp. TaxID=991866 RepID=UPI0026381EB6|nr:tetratricopeptide repeat protein [uncultured Maritimibacter sp.]